MPRPFSIQHVLRTARKIRGLSQKRLAQTVGVSTNVIKEIESGRTRPSRKLAHRISIATRLNYQQLLENSRPEAPRFYPELYESFENLVVSEAGQLGNVIRDMLALCKSSTQFFVVRWTIYEMLHEVGGKF